MSNEKYTRIRPIVNDVSEEETNPAMITILTSKMFARIKIEDIEYIEQEYRKLHIVTGDTDYVVYENINTIENAIGDNERFFRVFKTVIVNFEHINCIEDPYVRFDSGQELTMGRNNLCKTRTAFKKYLQKYHYDTIINQGYRVAEKIKKT